MSSSRKAQKNSQKACSLYTVVFLVAIGVAVLTLIFASYSFIRNSNFISKTAETVSSEIITLLTDLRVKNIDNVNQSKTDIDQNTDNANQSITTNDQNTTADSPVMKSQNAISARAQKSFDDIQIAKDDVIHIDQDRIDKILQYEKQIYELENQLTSTNLLTFIYSFLSGVLIAIGTKNLLDAENAAKESKNTAEKAKVAAKKSKDTAEEAKAAAEKTKNAAQKVKDEAKDAETAAEGAKIAAEEAKNAVKEAKDTSKYIDDFAEGMVSYLYLNPLYRISLEIQRWQIELVQSSNKNETVSQAINNINELMNSLYKVFCKSDSWKKRTAKSDFSNLFRQEVQILQLQIEKVFESMRIDNPILENAMTNWDTKLREIKRIVRESAKRK